MWLLIVIALTPTGELTLANRKDMLHSEAACHAKFAQDRKEYFADIQHMQHTCVRYTIPAPGPRT